MRGENFENWRSPKEFWKTKCFEALLFLVGVFLAGKIQQLQIKLPEMREGGRGRRSSVAMNRLTF